MLMLMVIFFLSGRDKYNDQIQEELLLTEGLAAAKRAQD